MEHLVDICAKKKSNIKINDINLKLYSYRECFKTVGSNKNNYYNNCLDLCCLNDNKKMLSKLIKHFNIQKKLIFTENILYIIFSNDKIKIFKCLVKLYNLESYILNGINKRCQNNMLYQCYIYSSFKIYKYLLNKYKITAKQLLENNNYTKCNMLEYIIKKYNITKEMIDIYIGLIKFILYLFQYHNELYILKIIKLLGITINDINIVCFNFYTSKKIGKIIEYKYILSNNKNYYELFQLIYK